MDCKDIRECVREEVITILEGLNSGQGQLGVGTVVATLAGGIAALEPGPVGEVLFAMAIQAGIWGSAGAATDLSSGGSITLPSTNEATLRDIYSNVIGGQDLRERLLQGNQLYPELVDSILPILADGLDTETIEQIQSRVNSTYGIGIGKYEDFDRLLEMTFGSGADGYKASATSLELKLTDLRALDDSINWNAVWFSQLLGTDRLQEMMGDDEFTEILSQRMSTFLFDETQNMQTAQETLLYESAFGKHTYLENDNEFGSAYAYLESPAERANFLLALQNPNFLPEYSDPAQSEILSSILDIENLDNKNDLLRLYAEGGWAIEATLGDDEARTFEADNEEALYQAFIDNPELIRSPTLANLFASDELKESFANMMLSVNEEEGSVQFGDRVDGLLSEAVEQAVTARLEQYGIILPEIQGDTFGSTELIQSQFPYTYGDQQLGYGRDEWGNLIFSSTGVDNNLPLSEQDYRITLDNLPLIGPSGYNSAYPISLFSYIPQTTAQDPGFWNIPSNDPAIASAYYDQQTREIVGTGLPVDGETGQPIDVESLKSQIKQELATESGYVKAEDVKKMMSGLRSEIGGLIGDAVSRAVSQIKIPECTCSNEDTVRWEDTPEGMAGESRGRVT